MSKSSFSHRSLHRHQTAHARAEVPAPLSAQSPRQHGGQHAARWPRPLRVPSRRRAAVDHVRLSRGHAQRRRGVRPPRTAGAATLDRLHGRRPQRPVLRESVRLVIVVIGAAERAKHLYTGGGRNGYAQTLVFEM